MSAVRARHRPPVLPNRNRPGDGFRQNSQAACCEVGTNPTACVTFIVQQAWMRHLVPMPNPIFLGSTLAPALLMLSPLAVIAAKDCTDWQPAAKVRKGDTSTPCKAPPLPLM
tara:strand:+ start:2041 stop:2376 length:336 start_codon:yes stop_codon:yes gene_type:complete